MAITKRYVHPQAETIREAIEKAQVAKSGHTSGHTEELVSKAHIGDTAVAA
jgi:predicted RNase H-like HicB family nuclease